EADDFLSKNEWSFGHLGYGLKNKLHGLDGIISDPAGFSESFFFHPEHLLILKEGGLEIHSQEPDQVFLEIMETALPVLQPVYKVRIRQRLSREAYLEKINRLQAHIQRGDCYEINFCQEFYAEGVDVDPLDVYLKLSLESPNPFSVFYRVHDSYLICASPERFLSKEGSRLLSQPIKGTIRRDLDNAENDAALEKELQQSSKDQAENVMVVDMVRNDLTRICEEATVQVDELFGIYRFPQVYQMISTISGEIKKEVLFSEIMAATFPMGSMTGAPKRRVMELIDRYEVSARGIFSGAVGYVSPDKDFDFNVVIRSIMYNAKDKYLSYQLGSGITIYSDPEKEWDECLLKGAAIRKVLGSELPVQE
ncbi:MAG: anthranilate synthase component I family protein, partial [Flavisolibacter sp.]